MNSDLSIQERTQRFADELAQRSRQPLDQAHAENNRLQADLASEQQRGDELQARLTEALERLMQLEQELEREREARQRSDHEVATIHAAIAHQLESAEQEQAALKAAEAERECQHREQLETLRGVGPVRAEAIIKGRPYRGKDELVRKNILPQGVYDDIKDRVIARQS